MNNCAKVKEKYAVLLADKDNFLKRHGEFKRAKTAEAKRNLLELMKKIRATETELRKDGDKYLIGLREEIAMRYDAKFVSVFQKGIAYAEIRDGGWILVNKQGDKIVDDIFDPGEVQSIKDGIAVVRELKRDYCIKSDGTIIDIKQAKATGNREFSEGYLMVERIIGGFASYSFMNEYGKMRPKKTNDWYDVAAPYSDGFALVSYRKDDFYFYIDKNGAVFDKNGQTKFRIASRFSENIAAVILNSEKNGNT
jgi:hypothetical protein